MSIMGGVYYWLPKWTGHMYDETLGKWHFWLTTIAFNVTFFPMHFLGSPACRGAFRITRCNLPTST
jgi:cytochrome c oxidase subunit 1